MLCTGILCGCKSAPKSEESKKAKPAAQEKAPGSRLPSGRKVTTSVAQPPPSRLAPSAAHQKPVLQPVESMVGRVIGGKEDLRFVVIDFSSSRLPPPDRRMNVYRGEQKVAEIKISGPYRGTTVVADILRGQAQYGDLVKPD